MWSWSSFLCGQLAPLFVSFWSFITTRTHMFFMGRALQCSGASSGPDKWMFCLVHTVVHCHWWTQRGNILEEYISTFTSKGKHSRSVKRPCSDLFYGLVLKCDTDLCSKICYQLIRPPIPLSCFISSSEDWRSYPRIVVVVVVLINILTVVFLARFLWTRWLKNF